ncbi:hypothetical protein SCUP234_10013 [Seiridium cupressi]
MYLETFVQDRNTSASSATSQGAALKHGQPAAIARPAVGAGQAMGGSWQTWRLVADRCGLTALPELGPLLFVGSLAAQVLCCCRPTSSATRCWLQLKLSKFEDPPYPQQRRHPTTYSLDIEPGTSSRALPGYCIAKRFVRPFRLLTPKQILPDSST